MIINALSEFYETLATQGKVERDGWQKKPVAQEICLDKNGNLIQIVNIKVPDNKKKLRPQEMPMPDWGSAAGSAIRSQFLCNNSGYVLGLSNRDNVSSDRLKKQVEDCNRLHHELLDDIKLPETEAVLTFLDFIYNDGQIPQDILNNLDKTALVSDNFIFSVNGVRLHEIPAVRNAWNKAYANSGDGEIGQCLVTGETGPIATKHPMIKGLRGAQGSGAGLSNYNCPSFESYGKSQNLNAPIGKHTAYAYTSALTYLLKEPKYHKALNDDLTIVWWPEDADDAYVEFCCAAAFGDTSQWSDSDISGMLSALTKGRPVSGLNPDRKFYVLGISPNSSRIIVRFFYEGSFGKILENVAAHYERLDILKPDDAGNLTVSRLLRAMAKDDANKEIPETIVNQLFQSILFGHKYPVQMLHMTMRRLMAGDNLNWQRAAVIKAYFLQFLDKNDARKECFKMSLDKNNTNPGYVLGRLLALYETVQYRANKSNTKKPASMHASFGAAMTTPGIIFPRLNQLVQVHLQKLSDGTRIWYDQQIRDVKALLGDTYPVRLSLAEQGAFDIGYYHQKQELFSKKTDTSVENNEDEE